MGHFGLENGASSGHSKNILEILHNERGQEVHGTYINSFSEKVSSGVNGPFWPENGTSS